ncbi:DMT family transporter [Maritalea sp. S77]|uniref:DMT family transporter n=1 Tax=Maritalea sp. S77 TaxID=3415125 RepID=UPI003C7E427D
MTLNSNQNLSLNAWISLLIASMFEIGYALSVDASEAFSNLPWSITAIIFFLLTLYFLSRALRSIDVGVGYAVWAGIGAVGAAIFGYLLFDQQLAFHQGIWLVLIIAGVVWLKLADSEKLNG